MRLVADIGGTNSRLAFASAHGVDVTTIRRYRNDDFDRFEDLLESYLADSAAEPIQDMVIAMAGTVGKNSARLTNCDWTVVSADFQSRFQTGPVTLINGLTALGHAFGHLGPEHRMALCNEPPAPDTAQNALVVGIGTGFNVSPVIRCGTHSVCPGVEAGNASLPMRVTVRRYHPTAIALAHEPDPGMGRDR